MRRRLELAISVPDKELTKTVIISFATTAEDIQHEFLGTNLITPKHMLYEIRQHDKKRFSRRLQPKESMMVLMFNWNLSPQTCSLVFKEEKESIYLNLRNVMQAN